jgi:ribonuclease HI
MEFKSKIKIPKKRMLTMLALVEGIPWGFFNGASQGYPSSYGIGAILYISTSHFYKIQFAQVQGTNMKVELSALWEFPLVVDTLTLQKFQLLGYSMIVVDWVEGKVQIQVSRLKPLM